MKNVYLAFAFILIVFSFGFSQDNFKKSWVFDFPENLNSEITEIESNNLFEAFGEDGYNRILKNNALKKYYLNILRNRVFIAIKKYNPNENILKLASVNNKLKTNVFNKNKFNPLMYDFNFNAKTFIMYRVGKTDQLVVINPQRKK